MSADADDVAANDDATADPGSADDVADDVAADDGLVAPLPDVIDERGAERLAGVAAADLARAAERLQSTALNYRRGDATDAEMQECIEDVVAGVAAFVQTEQ